MFKVQSWWYSLIHFPLYKSVTPPKKKSFYFLFRFTYVVIKCSSKAKFLFKKKCILFLWSCDLYVFSGYRPHVGATLSIRDFCGFKYYEELPKHISVNSSSDRDIFIYKICLLCIKGHFQISVFILFSELLSAMVYWHPFTLWILSLAMSLPNGYSINSPPSESGEDEEPLIKNNPGKFAIFLFIYHVISDNNYQRRRSPLLLDFNEAPIVKQLQVNMLSS